ncbi:sugar ABC transporter ATP-binding protein [Actinomycetaceae bacterium MB13-C1-2]|nr:sugar ABC transporter ATP-binding protein [Actinomycetaceae bacterium MB13-C1-2]
MSDPILEMRGITKVYPGVVALDDVSMSFEAGRAHAIVGENGAGKSTFIKSITGAITPSSGELVVAGKVVENNSPQVSLGLGIGAIYQEFSLIPHLSVAENVFFGRFPKRSGVIDRARMERETREIFAELGVGINPDALVANLSVGYQQMVEIARAISQKSRVLIMDEPSAPLTDAEMTHLYEVVEKLKARDVAIIYISHRLEEIFRICETVSVLRDGQLIVTMPVSQTSEDELVRLMVDRDVSRVYPPASASPGKVLLEVEGLSTEAVKDVSFEARAGEIVGLAGLVGAGRSEVARAVFGADPKRSGTVRVDGELREIRSPRDGVEAGIGLIPEDRKTQGLLLNLDIADNIIFAAMNKVSSGGVIDGARETAAATELSDSMRVRTPSVKAMVSGLSGGNQQKVVLAKWLLTDSKVLFFDEPTRGIDVGAKQEIYELMRRLVADGKSIVMISSELPELLGMSDRVIVMHEGRVAGQMDRLQATPERVMALASGTSLKEVK